MMPIWRPRRERMDSSERVSKSSPFHKIRPAVRACGGRRRMIASAVADLPLPDSPTKPGDSPAAMESERARTAGLEPKSIETCWRSSKGTSPFLIFSCRLSMEKHSRDGHEGIHDGMAFNAACRRYGRLRFYA